MRLIIKLKAVNSHSLTANYNYPLSSAVYNLLQFGSQQFSAFLHDIGFKAGGKTYKLFTFALRFEKIKYVNSSIKLVSPYAYLYISSPLVEDFINNFVIGTFEKQYIEIRGNNCTAKFDIQQIESLPEIQFEDTMHFSMLSPMVLSTKKFHNGKLKQYFLRQNDLPDINRILNINLHNKYKLIYNNDCADTLSFEWDEQYLKKKNRITKKITINERGEYPVEVIGLFAPFKLKGSPALIKIGYEAGFGEKNSMGFGMAAVL